MSRRDARWVGPACAFLGVLGFSFKGILAKLVHQAYPVEAVTLLALRMLYSAPFFVLMAYLASRGPDVAPIVRRDWRRILWLGFIGYYVSSLLDFTGLQYITASLERLVMFLYPTLVVLLSALLLRKPVTQRAVVALVVSYAGIALVVGHDLRASTDATGTLTGIAFVFVSAILYSLYLVQAGEVIARLGSLRFIAWAMLVSTACIAVHFLLLQPFSKLDVPLRVHLLLIAMAVLSTVLPTWLIAESIRRLGANTASLLGSLGPVFTIGFGVSLLGETLNTAQVVGATLVVAGVMLVTLRRGAGNAARKR